ncbi:MAG: hypothetical protein ABSB78_14105 [Bacteroidota bacterium]
MDNFLNAQGFLGTHATFRSDASLVLILLSMVLFTVGWQLRIHHRKRLHCFIQPAAVILNAAVVAVVMIGTFVAVILPGIPAKLFEGSYGITVVHGLIGAISVVFGIFVVLRANQLVPQPLRFNNYKLFMRTSYILYLLSTALGVVVYLVVYVGGS